MSTVIPLPIVLQADLLAQIIRDHEDRDAVNIILVEQVGRFRTEIVASMVLPEDDTAMTAEVVDDVEWWLWGEDPSDDFTVDQHVDHLLECAFGSLWRQWSDDRQTEVRTAIADRITEPHELARADLLHRIAAHHANEVRRLANRYGDEFITTAIEEHQ